MTCRVWDVRWSSCIPPRSILFDSWTFAFLDTEMRFVEENTRVIRSRTIRRLPIVFIFLLLRRKLRLSIVSRNLLDCCCSRFFLDLLQMRCQLLKAMLALLTLAVKERCRLWFLRSKPEAFAKLSLLNKWCPKRVFKLEGIWVCSVDCSYQPSCFFLWFKSQSSEEVVDMAFGSGFYEYCVGVLFAAAVLPQFVLDKLGILPNHLIWIHFYRFLSESTDINKKGLLNAFVGWTDNVLVE